jgi:predicted AAA+ superfamily ATPase
MHPLSLAELGAQPTAQDLESLLKYGGFPEPFYKQDEEFWRRWQMERKTRVLFEDILSLEHVKQVSDMQILTELLILRSGSLLSINSLREDLRLAHETVERYVQILERLFFCFRVAPYHQLEHKTLHKEKKLFLWDWSQCKNQGAKFENLVASQLLKFCHLRQDSQGYLMRLHYLRDAQKNEIDFVVTQDQDVLFAVECKTGERSLSKNIPFFAERSKIPMFYQVHLGERDYLQLGGRARVLPWITFCKELQMP